MPRGKKIESHAEDLKELDIDIEAWRNSTNNAGLSFLEAYKKQQ